MKAVIKGQPVELSIVTVSLRPTKANDLILFYCPNDGKEIAQIQGEVARMRPYDEPDDSLPVLKLCQKCGMRYSFQTHEEYKKEGVDVVVKHSPQRPSFYCWHSRDLIISTAFLAPHMTIKCPDPTCGVVYYFSDLL